MLLDCSTWNSPRILRSWQHSSDQLALGHPTTCLHHVSLLRLKRPLLRRPRKRAYLPEESEPPSDLSQKMNALMIPDVQKQMRIESEAYCAICTEDLLRKPQSSIFMSYGQNSVSKLMDAELGVSLLRWSRRFTRVLCTTYGRQTVGVSLSDVWCRFTRVNN